MNILKKSIALCLFFISALPGILASHMMGGEITYKYAGGQKYEIYARVYRDCRGIPFNSPTMVIYDPSGSASASINYTRISIEDLTPVCSKNSAPCYPQNTTVSGTGIELHTFFATLDFASAPLSSTFSGKCELRITLEQCCRNGAITNITAGNFYVESMINKCYANSSPEFVNSGYLNLTCNQPFRYNIGAYDNIDHDSLRYELVNPLNAQNSNESYTGSFNTNIPMTPYCPPNPGVINCKPLPNAVPPRGFYFDIKNGDMVLTPTKCDEVAVISVKITEYGKINGSWKMKGWVCRDIQFSVKSNTNYKNDGPQVTIASSYTFKTRERQCFDIVSKDTVVSGYDSSNRGDSTEITVLNLPQGAKLAYKDSNARNKTAEFCWTVHDSVYLQLQTLNRTLPLIVEVRDNYCPAPGVIRKTLSLKILPPDSSGLLDITTFSDKNKNGLKDGSEKNVRTKLSFKDNSSSYYINTDKDGHFKDAVGRGQLTVGLANQPYIATVSRDTTFNVQFDSTYKLAFGHYKKNGIYGRIYSDGNSNCQYDPGEQVFPGVKVTTDSNKYTGISDAEGVYFIAVPKGNYTLKCQYKANYLTINCPSGKTRTITITVDSAYEDNDFGISKNKDYTDVQTGIFAYRMRRGFDSYIEVYCNNRGNQIARNIHFYLPINSNFSMKRDSVTYAAGDTATFTIDSLLPGKFVSYKLTYTISASKFKSNDRICFTVTTDSITLGQDSVKFNNTTKTCGVVDAPYDPNDKTVSDSEVKTILDNNISYTVRFQNTGTDTATRIVVTDTVDTRYLDISAFDLNWSSAPCDVAITGNILHFTFEDIMLPQLSKAGDKSIGSFNFSLGLKQGFMTEQAFDNRVSIYFDFEDPIHTDKAHTDLLSPVSITDLGNPSICGNKETVVKFKSNVAIGKNNTYILERSDMNGDFGFPVTMTSVTSTLLADSFKFYSPQGLTGNYKLRIRTTNPATVSVPGSGVIDFQALLKPSLIISSNLNNYSLCSKDTLKMEIMNHGYIYKLLKNGSQLSDFNTIKKYNLMLNEGDKILVVAKDAVNLCTDTTDLKLNVLRLPVVKASIPGRKSKYCEGEEITMKVSGGIFYTYFNNKVIILNNTKDSSHKIKLSGMSVFSVSGTGDNGCSGVSDTLMVTVNPLPLKPAILKYNNTLAISHTGLVKWYRNGILVNHTGNTLTNAESGTYTATAVSSEGCESSSDPFTHFNSAIDETLSSNIKVYPNPASGMIRIEQESTRDLQIGIYDMSGRLILSRSMNTQSTDIDLTLFSNGLYRIKVSDANGFVSNIILTINR